MGGLAVGGKLQLSVRVRGANELPTVVSIVSVLSELAAPQTIFFKNYLPSGVGGHQF